MLIIAIFLSQPFLEKQGGCGIPGFHKGRMTRDFGRRLTHTE